MATLPSTNVYFGNDTVIVAPLHMSGTGGFTYEQSDASIVLKKTSEAELGAAVKNALQKFSIRIANLRNYKKTDWPAFRASGKKTVKSFEKDFVIIQISLLAPSGNIRATAHINELSLDYTFEFDSLLPDEEVGLRLNGLLSSATGCLIKPPAEIASAPPPDQPPPQPAAHTIRPAVR